MAYRSYRDYSPGYEPSAPPAPPGAFSDDQPRWQGQGGNGNAGGSFGYGPAPGGYGAPVERGHYRDETVGEHIVGQIRGAMRALWGRSHTILRVDLLRPLKFRGPIFEAQDAGGIDGWTPNGPPQGRGYYNQPPPGANYGGYSPNAGYNNRQGNSMTNWLQGIGNLDKGGARLKLMQVWELSDHFSESTLPYEMNLGLGANFDMDQSVLEPKLRIRARHMALHLLPKPELELRGRWPIGDTNLALAVRYRVPVSSAHRFWEADGGARLMVNLYNPVGTGFHLMPGGLEFDEQVVRLGKNVALRVAATLHFPRKIPLDEGEPPLKISMHRLGLKARIQA